MGSDPTQEEDPPHHFLHHPIPSRIMRLDGVSEFLSSIITMWDLKGWEIVKELQHSLNRRVMRRGSHVPSMQRLPLGRRSSGVEEAS